MATTKSTSAPKAEPKTRAPRADRLERLRAELAEAEAAARTAAQKKVAILRDQLEALYKRHAELAEKIAAKKAEIVAAEAEVIPENDGVGIVPAPEPELPVHRAEPEG